MEEKIIEYFDMNKLQTPLTQELMEEIPKEVWEELIYTMQQIKFIQNIIAPEEVRGYAKDKKRVVYNEAGDTRIEITKTTLVNPHILQNMAFFTKRARYYKENKKYTNLIPSKNPNSEYFKFWKEEVRRWKDGVVRKSDGEWISGPYYFYLNYCPILVNKEVKSPSSKNTNRKAGKMSAKKIRGERMVDFPEVWLGDYLWFHYRELAQDNGAHCSLLKSRQRGFSYKTASEGPRNMYTMPDLPNYYIAIDNTYLVGIDGIFPKATGMLDWIGSTTPLPKLRLIDRAAEKKFGYKDEYGIEKGLKSSMSGISVKDNPNKARGIRAPFILYEEAGTIDNLEQTWNINRNAVEEGNLVFGMMVAGGTGGTSGAKFDGLRKLFYRPAAYNILGMPNVFDKGADGSKEVGFFWPTYINRKNCYDIDGNPDIVKALVEIIMDRHVIKYNSQDPNALTQRKAEEPITPQEAILRTESRIFPVSDLKDIKEKLILNASFEAEHYIGRIGESDGRHKFIPETLYPIREFPLKNSVVDGSIEMFELPKTILTEDKPRRGRYVAAMDPYANDAEETDSVSIGSFFVLDLLTDRVVAEYSGRPVMTDDFFEGCMRLAEFYNCQILYESNIKGFYYYARDKNKLWMLMDRPEILSDKDFVKAGTIGNTIKGLPSSENIKAWGRTLSREWMLTKATSQPEDIDETDEYAVVRNMQTLRSPALLEEFINWNLDGNFDRVSAFIVLMIARAEMKGKFLLTQKGDTQSPAEDPTYITNSRFFKGFMDNKRRSR